VILHQAPPVQPKPKQASLEQQRLDYFRLKKEEVERTIKKREEHIASMGKLYQEKPSLQASLDYLQGLGVKVNKDNNNRAVSF
jgi:hypothetical protein